LELELLAEEGPLARQLRRGEVRLPDDDTVVEMQRTVSEIYARAGLSRYEISNYARGGFHSRHNAAYWTGGEYFALGAGATGRMGLRRYQNHRSAEKYWADIEANRWPEAQIETLDIETLAKERISMGLRLTSGIHLEGRAEVVTRLEREGLLVVGDRVQLTPRGMDLHSSIAAALM
jgi:oxygen-independent coproporphyrinogen-3 oxidase